MSTHVALPLVSIFAIVDGSFVIAGLPKFIDGGWVPFITSAVLCLISFTWLDGRRRLVDALSQAQVPIEVVHELVGDVDDPALPTVVLLTPDAEGVPFAASHPWMRQQLHAISLVLLKVEGMHVPRVAQHERVTVRCLGPRLTIVEAYVGYMELPHLAPILEGCKTAGLDLAHENIIYASAVSRIDTGGPQTILERFHRSLFAALLRNARQISDDLEIPAQQR
jgi:KUP system potassium uptake protein